ncbi:MAG: hypothetical protein JWP12_26 [Bacteroidetes bacterium]|nr:hypothetical protein [Bacteroidota bacterium]
MSGFFSSVLLLFEGKSNNPARAGSACNVIFPSAGAVGKPRLISRIRLIAP